MDDSVYFQETEDINTEEIALIRIINQTEVLESSITTEYMFVAIYMSILSLLLLLVWVYHLKEQSARMSCKVTSIQDLKIAAV